LTILIESQYFPPISTFALLKNANRVVIDAHSYFEKGTYRNRCHILGANGKQRLSVPLVKGKHQKTPMSDVLISFDENWKKHHWQSFVTAYSRSPFFMFYADELKELFFKPYSHLLHLNQHMLLWLIDQLNLSIAVDTTTAYVEQSEANFDYRNVIHPQKKKMRLNVNHKAYEQVFADKHEFQPNLSILDLLFTQGPNATAYF